MKKILRTVLVLMTLILLSVPVKAQLMWNIKGGLTQRSFEERYGYYDYDWDYTTYEDVKENRWEWTASIEMEIPLKNRLTLETGLRYKNDRNLLELPMRLTCKLPLGEHFTLHAGIGPYFAYGKKLTMGIEPSVTINWSCLTLGLASTYDFSLDGKRSSPSMMMTFGFRFKTKTWKYIGIGVLAVATVGAAAGAAYSTINNQGTGTGYDNNYNSSSSGYSSSGSSVNKSSSGSSGSSDNTHSVSEVQAKNTDANTYSRYETELIKMNTYPEKYSNFDSNRREIQSKMRAIRTKWEKRGFQMYHSSWEDWNGSKK